VGRRMRGRDNGSNVNNVQYKSNWNYHYEFLPIIYPNKKFIKKFKKKDGRKGARLNSLHKFLERGSRFRIPKFRGAKELRSEKYCIFLLLF
jgi:hypothetical protein